MKSIIFLLGVVFVGIAAAASTDDLKGFAKWIGENGVETKVNLGRYGDSRFGAVAAKDISEGDALLRIPKKLIISLNTIRESDYTPIKEYKDWVLHNEPFVAFFLKDRLNANSFYQPYYRILPEFSDFSNHPIQWSEEDLKLLQSSPGYSNTLSLQRSLKYAYKTFSEKFVASNPNFYPEGYITYENYLWGYLLAGTRQWSSVDGNVWVPLADMLNHKPTAGVGSMDISGQYFVINATQEYKSGDQVYDSYGPKSNEELFRFYGFVPEENAADFLKVAIQSTAVNLVQSVITPVLEKVDPNWRDVYLQKNRRSDTLLRAFRLNQLEFKELEWLNDAVAGKPISLINELRAYRSAISVLTQLLQSYSTTAEEDTELLKKEGLSLKETFAIRLRRGEKEIIKNQILVIGKLWENILIEGTLPGGVPVR